MLICPPCYRLSATLSLFLPSGDQTAVSTQTLLGLRRGGGGGGGGAGRRGRWEWREVELDWHVQHGALRERLCDVRVCNLSTEYTALLWRGLAKPS